MRLYSAGDNNTTACTRGHLHRGRSSARGPPPPLGQSRRSRGGRDRSARRGRRHGAPDRVGRARCRLPARGRGARDLVVAPRSRAHPRRGSTHRRRGSRRPRGSRGGSARRVVVLDHKDQALLVHVGLSAPADFLRPRRRGEIVGARRALESPNRCSKPVSPTPIGAVAKPVSPTPIGAVALAAFCGEACPNSHEENRKLRAFL
jgi:hypothetical protein